MKKAKKFLVLACLGCLGYGLAKLVQTDEAKEKLFGILGEDLYLGGQDKVDLRGDLLMWRIDLVRGLRP